MEEIAITLLTGKQPEYLPPVITRVSLTYWSMRPSKLSSPL